MVNILERKRNAGHWDKKKLRVNYKDSFKGGNVILHYHIHFFFFLYIYRGYLFVFGERSKFISSS